jgi:uridine kinase
MSTIEHVSYKSKKSFSKNKICIIVSGLQRGFYSNLFPFLVSLPQDDYDIYLNFSNNDSKFMSFNHGLEDSSIVYNSNFKHLFVELPKIDSKYSNRETNTFLQYYRFLEIIKQIDDIVLEGLNSYKGIVRIRPDIQFKCSISEFQTLIQTIVCNSEFEKENIYIPKGYNIFDSRFVKENNILIEECINDQICICNPHIFRLYANTYILLSDHTIPIVSEHLLYKQLISNKVIINRIDIEYTLVLSNCTTIAISGDSASGKSHLLKLLSQIFPYDQKILLETDRYHKYERYDENWKSLTHLNPCANNLEKMADDLYHLRLGNDVFSVDYDHKTGKFTEPELIHSKPFLLLCGLHTMYSNSIRSMSDLKIFMDTPTNLKKYWKVLRDVKERNHSLQSILSTIERRISDFESFILPQKDHANIIIKFESLIDLPDFSSSSSSDFVDLSGFKQLFDNQLQLTITFDIDIFNLMKDSIMDYVISTTLLNIENGTNKKVEVVFKHDLDISYNNLLKLIFESILYI